MSICRIASNIVKNVNNLHKLKTKNSRKSYIKNHTSTVLLLNHKTVDIFNCKGCTFRFYVIYYIQNLNSHFLIINGCNFVIYKLYIIERLR